MRLVLQKMVLIYRQRVCCCPLFIIFVTVSLKLYSFLKLLASCTAFEFTKIIIDNHLIEI